ncbi:hypothetical protein [Chryseobacterium sp. JK1]|uniref:hypothetical protein n=1 Tax=Chryseobacterium sp. JK1 TaxID=874294 RepID=UPI003D68D0A2
MRNKNLEFILALIKKTNNKEIIWQIVNHQISLPYEEKITSKIYKTTIQGKHFRLFEYQYKHYTDEDEWLWVQRKKIELIDNENEKLYEFNYEYSINDLFDAVTRQTSGIEDFLNDFLE